MRFVPSVHFPLTLARLRTATAAQRDTAWAEFVAAHSNVVLHACRSIAREHDAAMDAYAHVLEALREDSCRRLRAYVPDGRTKFTTWLVVVTRRLALDYMRHRYGRPRSEDQSKRAESRMRRHLEDLLADQVDPDLLVSATEPAPDATIRREQLASALHHALADLTPADRLLVTLRYNDGIPVRDIAKMLRLPTVFHVYRRLDAAIDALRDALRRRGIEDAEP